MAAAAGATVEDRKVGGSNPARKFIFFSSDLAEIHREGGSGPPFRAPRVHRTGV